MNTMDNMRRISVAIVMIIVMQSVFCSCNSDEQNTTFTQDFSPIKIEETEAQDETLHSEETIEYVDSMEFSVLGDDRIVGQLDNINFDAVVNDYGCTVASIYEIEEYDQREYGLDQVFLDIEGYEFGSFNQSVGNNYSRTDNESYMQSIINSFEFVDVDVSIFDANINNELVDVSFSTHAIYYYFSEGWNENRFSIFSLNPDTTMPAEFELISIRQEIDGIPLSVPRFNDSSYSGVTYNSLESPITGWIIGYNRDSCLMDENTFYAFRFLEAKDTHLIVENREILPIYSCVNNAIPGLQKIMSDYFASYINVYAVELEYNVVTDRHNHDFKASDKYYLVPTWSLLCQREDINGGEFFTVYLDAFTGKLLYTNV